MRTTTALILPRDAGDKWNEYVMLSDIFPTGYHATEMAQLQSRASRCVIYGAGPVGLMAALSAQVKGASMVMVVDTHKDRLALAEKIGAVPIDDTEGGGSSASWNSPAGAARTADANAWATSAATCTRRNRTASP
jgi:threonine dehydrogenase-like Zn-dependent dehydrogenase